eukprot:scaffold91941_cov65-Attheya_sp.AAC.1
MSLQFEWPACAANRDRLELEYISALGQSGPKIRPDGTISGLAYDYDPMHSLLCRLHRHRLP